MQTQFGPFLADMLLKVAQTNVFQVGMDFSTKFQMLNKINCMNHIQCVISQPSINLQQGQHVLCLHNFFCCMLAFWLYFILVFLYKVRSESNGNLIFNVSLSIFLIAFKAKSMVSNYCQFFLARIYERTLKNY